MKISGCEYNTISKLKTEKGKKVYKIPYYQRPYEWDKENISSLINDFEKNKKLNEKDTGLEYFAGAVVFVDGKENELEVVDGQQRITTLFLLNALRFMILRARVDSDINSSKYIGNVGRGCKDLVNAYADIFALDNFDDANKMVEEIEQCISEGFCSGPEKMKHYIEKAKKCFQGFMHTIQKSTDEDDYIAESQNESHKLYEKNSLVLQYSLSAYNDKMKQALSKVVCIVDPISEETKFLLNDNDIKKIEKEDSIVGQYVESIKIEYDTCKEIIKDRGAEGRDFTKQLLELIQEMMDNIKLCAVFAENERDAYVLFESLNDRNKRVGDLELIKNLYLRSYYNKSGETESEREKGLDVIAKVWDDHIFTQANRGEVSLLGTVYLTGTVDLDGKNDDRIRKTVDKYLEEKEKYTLQQAVNDVKIYKMVRIIIDSCNPNSMKLNDNLLCQENNVNCSVVCKTVCLLQALKIPNVLSGLVNVILHFYLKDNSDGDDIDLNDFEKNYIQNLYYDNTWDFEYREQIYSMAHNMWRLTLLAKNYEVPRLYSVKLIEEFKKGTKKDTTVDITLKWINQANEEFISWTKEWRYTGSNKRNIRLKVLFFRLLQTIHSKGAPLLTVNPTTKITFQKPELSQLDHLEPENPEEKHGYFSPTSGMTRDEIVNGLGNFMLLDNSNNNSKDNCRFEDAIKHYEKMFGGNVKHWLIQEIEDAFQDESLIQEVEGHKIPTEEFFIQRRNSLIGYFKSLLNAEKYDEDKIEIIQ
ncbi:MAG: DUF262 domain-containing protein [Clostridiales bacterium]|nr:DUF262 domain-containing protein [Clostridiales bacterium]